MGAVRVYELTTVYVGGDKSELMVFATPIAAVRYRIESMYVHLDEPDVVEEARRLVASNSQRRAWRFLLSRRDHEYEGIERYEVIE